MKLSSIAILLLGGAGVVNAQNTTVQSLSSYGLTDGDIKYLEGVFTGVDEQVLAKAAATIAPAEQADILARIQERALIPDEAHEGGRMLKIESYSMQEIADLAKSASKKWHGSGLKNALVSKNAQKARIKKCNILNRIPAPISGTSCGQCETGYIDPDHMLLYDRTSQYNLKYKARNVFALPDTSKTGWDLVGCYATMKHDQRTGVHSFSWADIDCDTTCLKDGPWFDPWAGYRHAEFLRKEEIRVLGEYCTDSDQCLSDNCYGSTTCECNKGGQNECPDGYVCKHHLQSANQCENGGTAINWKTDYDFPTEYIRQYEQAHGIQELISKRVFHPHYAWKSYTRGPNGKALVDDETRVFIKATDGN